MKRPDATARKTESPKSKTRQGEVVVPPVSLDFTAVLEQAGSTHSEQVVPYVGRCEAFLTIWVPRGADAAQENEPPARALELIDLLYDPKKADVLIGDLTEGFHKRVKRTDARTATRWVWAQAMRSVGPLVW